MQTKTLESKKNLLNQIYINISCVLRNSAADIEAENKTTCLPHSFIYSSIYPSTFICSSIHTSSFIY